MPTPLATAAIGLSFVGAAAFKLTARALGIDTPWWCVIPLAMQAGNIAVAWYKRGHKWPY